MNIVEHNQLKIDAELLSLCKEIYAENKTEDEWAQIESCDMFQSENYCGGYSAIEKAFWFSYYDLTGKEWWFEITVESLTKIITGDLQFIKLYEPNE